jgi:hypothetical protein
MVITFKKANEKFLKLDDRWEGIKYGPCFAFRINNKICITYRGKPILWINKKNEYEFTCSRNETQRKFFNKYTPITIRKRKGDWYVGRMPFHLGMKVNKNGEFIIPDVWPPRDHIHECTDCGDTFTNDLCAYCYENFIDGEGQW